jgi:outer membrane protein TolC
MHFGKRGAAALTALAITSVTAACTSTTTRTNIQSAEAAADVRTSVPGLVAPDAAAPVAPSAPAADEAALERPVDLASLEAAALARHPSLVAAAHRARALAERARAEGSMPPPEFMAEIWQVPFVRPYALDRAGMIMFSLRQSIPAAGSLDAMADASALEARAETAKAGAEARALVHDVDRAFADYAEATAVHAAHVTHRALVSEMGSAARARYTTGGSLADLTKADLERARLDVHIAHEHGMAEEARAKLNGLLVRPLDAPLGAPRSTEPETVRLSPEEAAQRAAERSPDVVAAELMEKSARSSVRAAEREAVVPSFSVGLDAFLPVNNTPAGYGVSFSMSLPWLWGAASHREKSAEQRALAERAQADTARLRARTSVASALASVRAAERRYLILQDVAGPASRRALDAARAGYATGGVDVLAWLDAARSSLDVAVELVNARGDLDRALADADFAAGGRLPRAPLAAPKEQSHEP